MGRCPGSAARRTRSKRNDSDDVSEWGRVADDGTVYVRTADGERPSGSTPRGRPRRRWPSSPSGTTSWPSRSTCSSSGSRPAWCRPTRPTESVRNRPRPGGRRPRGRRPRPRWSAGSTRCARSSRSSAQARRGRARRRRPPAAKAEKERLVAEAEKLAEGNDWRNGANRLRAAARRVEGAPPDRPGLRRRAVAPVLDRAHVVHPAPQGALRRAEREARGRPGRQGAAGQGGRGAGRLHRVGSDRRRATAT